ncbi:hypothetical protein SBY92_002488 [Candida maltosa Xu316]
MQTSIECLNNSLKIVAAASKFTIKRPPLRRPKNKPGKPKDFVFVDLSPVQSEEEETTTTAKLNTPSSSRRTSTASAPAVLTPATPMTANTSIDTLNNNDNGLCCTNDILMNNFNVAAPVAAAPISACPPPIESFGGLPSPVESLDDFLISEFDLWDNSEVNWESILQNQSQPQQPQQPVQQQEVTPNNNGFQEFMDIVSIVQQQQEQIQQLQQQLQQIKTTPPITTTSSSNKYIDFSF